MHNVDLTKKIGPPSVWSNADYYVIEKQRMTVRVEKNNLVNDLKMISKEEKNENKCVSRTDTNPPFAFQTAFPLGTDFSVSTGRVKKLHTLLVSLYF